MNPSSLQFNVQNNHPLIPREQYYTLDRKLVTIHSEDRDTCKWPNSNEFEIELPETIQNVQSIRLAETAMPSNFYNISKQFQNTTLSYTVHKLLGGKEKQIELCDGFYTPLQLACILTKLFHHPLQKIIVKYDPILQRFVFISNHPFTFHFDKLSCYVPDCNNKNQTWCQNTKWGLGYYLGFNKEEYNSVEKKNSKDDCSIKNCLSELLDAPSSIKNDCSHENDLVDYHELTMLDHHSKHILVAPNFPKLEGEQVIYMEVEKFNTYDEICPFPSQSNSMFSNTYCGKVNSAFAKIPLLNGPSPDGSKTFFDSRNDSFLNISYHDPPVEKIKKLKFKFRYHNGELVDFQHSPFTFTVEFNSLRNDIEKNYRVRLPHIFS